MELTIHKACKEEIYKDFVRIPEKFRKNRCGQTIPSGTLCKIIIKNKKGYAIGRGLENSEDPIIKMDEKMRNHFEVNVNDKVEITLKKGGCFGGFIWAWKASDPAYRIMARLALLSVILGVLGLILGLIGLKVARL